MIEKKAQYTTMEDSGLSESGARIFVSAKMRDYWRKVFGEKKASGRDDINYSELRNDDLNKIIAKEFLDSSGKIVRRFPLKNPQSPDSYAELRQLKGTTMFFVSGFDSGTISLFSLQSGYKRQKKEDRSPGIESALEKDSVTGLDIYISITARKKWREEFLQSESPIRNAELNKIIAKEFSSSKVVRKFPFIGSKSIKNQYAEIRKMANLPQYFVSGVKGGKIIIFTIQSTIKSGKK